MSVLLALAIAPLLQGPPVVFNNTAPSGLFHDVTAGLTVFDEGRIPSTSAPEGGAQNTYSITQLELGYATRSLTPSLGGPGARIVLSFYAQGDASTDPLDLSVPLATFDLTGLPASTAAGTLSTHTIPYFLPYPVCFRADGNGQYDPAAGNDFVWSISMPDEVNGPAGPLIAGDPQSCPEGDGTFFQGPGNCGTGLGSVDAFGELNAAGDFSYRNFGGYPQNAFGSFHLKALAPLSGECAGCGIADPYLEANDTCPEAIQIAQGKTFGLISEAGDDDFYQITVPGSAQVSIDALFDVATGDIDLELYEVGCGALLASSALNASNESLRYFDCGGASRDLVVRVVAPAGGCTVYDLVIDASPVVDDAFEDNDICSQSALAGISTFTTTGLLVSECDSDYFVLKVSDQREVRVDLFFSNADSDVDVRLWDQNCQVLLASSLGAGDSETVSYFNGTGAEVDVIAEIVCDGGDGHATYSLSACYSVGDLISFQSCAGVTNSTGRPATMCARGSDVADDNLVLFYAVDLPPFAFGYFVTSLVTGFVPNPAGATGTLCLGGGSVGRYFDDVLQTSGTSAVFYQPDLTRTPAASTYVPTVAGETRYWQFWYRDTTPAGGTTSNFTSGTGIVFR